VELREWREPDRIAELATLVVVGREGVSLDEAGSATLDSGRVVRCVFPEIRRIDISSSAIRDRVRKGCSIRYLVPPNVRRIIEDHRLYRPIS